MKRYWHFLIVGVICLLVALLWAQPPHHHAPAPQTVAVMADATPVQKSSGATASAGKPAPAKDAGLRNKEDDQPLPGSSSSLPLLAVIGFGVLAGGITSAMRTR
ncbi:MAG TPA: hypothetical protein VGR48_15355 [Terriglobales bacterium]|nr:hypothetical protein [Terriglobales bacterium]